MEVTSIVVACGIVVVLGVLGYWYIRKHGADKEKQRSHSKKSSSSSRTKTVDDSVNPAVFAAADDAIDEADSSDSSDTGTSDSGAGGGGA